MLILLIALALLGGILIGVALARAEQARDLKVTLGEPL